VGIDQLPQGEYAAIEKCEISTHNGTHLDAPYPYFSSMNHTLKEGGEGVDEAGEMADQCRMFPQKFVVRRFRWMARSTGSASLLRSVVDQFSALTSSF
jgi:hypothetical protein